MIQLENIVKTYPMGKSELKVLQGVNLNIDKGEMVAIMGASGSGKSTLLNMIGLLDRPTSGSYLLEGEEVAHLNAKSLAKVRGQKIGFICSQECRTGAEVRPETQSPGSERSAGKSGTGRPYETPPE